MIDNSFIFIVVVVLLVTLVLGFLLGFVGHSLLSGTRSSKEKQKDKNKRKTAQADRVNMHMVSRMVSELSATLNYGKVLETALDMGVETFTIPIDQSAELVCAFYLFAEEQDDTGATTLKVGSARRFTSADMRMNLEAKQGLIAKAIDEGEGQFSTEITKDPELERIIAFRTCKVAYCIPLRAGLESYGILLFAHPDAGCFTPDRKELLDLIGRQTMIAMQNASLYSDLEQEKEHIMATQEEARKTLARELHDGPTQSVSAIAMQASYTRRLMQQNPAAAAEELVKIEDLARRTTKEIRHMLFTLRPLTLESQGLVGALGDMAAKMSETYQQNVEIDVQENVVEQLDVSKQMVVFYIAEEAVNNARKHAQAAHIWVRFKQMKPGLALLEVQDDGIGFDTKSVEADYEHRGSLGMVNMRERAELVNGVLHILSAEGKGTRVQVAIPLTEEIAERLRNRSL